MAPNVAALAAGVRVAFGAPGEGFRRVQRQTVYTDKMNSMGTAEQKARP